MVPFASFRVTSPLPLPGPYDTVSFFAMP
jgi:hypothetical protein